MNDMIKLLAVDLDDTLLSEELTIPDDNKRALTAAMNAGIKVILASGRTFFSMEKYAAELGMSGREGYMICSNGSSVYEMRTGNAVYTKTVPADAAAEAWNIVKRYSLTMQYYGHGVIYSSGTNSYTDRDCRFTGQRLECIDDFDKALEGEQAKFVIPGDPDLLADVERELKSALSGRCNIFVSKPYFLEILPGDADKATALAYVAESYGFFRGEVMAVGDSMNDLGMITWAGTGVAMSNGIEEVRMRADDVTQLTNDEGGVAWAVDKYILSPVTAAET